jgi:DNA polymerase elongation subunit (family B)
MYQNIFVGKAPDDEETQAYIWDDKEGLLKLPYSQFDYAYRKDPEGDLTSLYGDKVKKVFHFNREGDSNYFETDVPRETRVLIDKYLNEDAPSEGHVILFFDIEVSMEGALPDPMAGNQPITAISYQDTASNEEVVLVLVPEQTEPYELDGAKVWPFDDEIQMLAYFLDTVELIHPTIISGWNSDYFDVPYLYNRIKKIMGANNARRLSPIDVVKFNPIKEKYSIAGISSIDLMLAYKNFTYSEKPTYRLDAIGLDEVNMGKIEYEGTLDNLYKTDKPKFVKYSLTDVRILRALNDKMKLIELLVGVCSIGHIPYEKFSQSSSYIEGTILTYLHRKGIVSPNKSEEGRAKMDELKESGKKGFEGAYVKDPAPGLHKWVYSLDIQSLYPSMIMTLNISPETKVGFVENWSPINHSAGKVSEYVVTDLKRAEKKPMNKERFEKFIKDSHFSISSNGVIYRNDKTGIIPEIINNWFSDRIKFQKVQKAAKKAGDLTKADFYDKRQHIQKIFLNSIYGVLGLPVFRFYDIDNAQAVTLSGQDVIKTSAKLINAEYQKKLETKDDYCIYSDTDSLYFSADCLLDQSATKEEKKKETILLARSNEKHLNKFYDIMAPKLFFVEQHRIFIKGEKVARSAFWTKKKRYAMQVVYNLEDDQDEDKLKIVGLDVVRSSFPPAFAAMMKDLLSDILNEVPKEKIDQKIVDFKGKLKDIDLYDITKVTAANNISQYDIADGSLSEFTTGTPAHVKAAISYNRLLKYFKSTRVEPIRDGEKIRWVYLKTNPYALSAVAFKGFGDPKPIMEFIREYVDYDKVFDSELTNKLGLFYESLNWGKISTEVNQKAQEFFTF